MDALNQPVKILLAEDVPTDAELVKREIKKVLPGSMFKVVDTREDFSNAIVNFTPDIILSDYRMPTFDGMSALKITLSLSPDTPVIIVTGSINEETAVNCMKAGAVDYVLKESLKRLGQAVLNALEQKEIKQQRNEAEKRLKESEERFRRLAENAQDLIYRIQFVPERKFIYVSPSSFELTGYTPEEHYADPDLGYKLVHPDDRYQLEKIMYDVHEIRKPMVFRWIKKDGKIIWTEQRNIPIYDEAGNLIAIEGIARDITDLKLAMDTLRQSEKDYRRLINGMNDTVWIIDPTDGKIIDVNKTAEKTLGYTREEIKEIGLAGIDCYLSKDEIIRLHKSIFSVKFQIFETRHRAKNGNKIPIEISSSLIKYRGREVILSVGRDITERLKLNQELLTAKEKAEESDRLKSAFLANMSHEIRTPMNGILGFANLLKEPYLSDKEKESFIEIIEKSGERMLATLNDLIDISKIESGIVEIENSLVNVHLEMQLLHNFFEPEANGKGLSLIYRVNSKITDFTMLTDRLKLNAVLTNLVKNALKYTNKGSVEFGFNIENNEAQFFVKDTGIGIETEKQEAVFERFIQADNSISRNYEGSGLGLSISKAYIEMLGGKIWVVSEKGKGSTFYFVLPLSQTDSKTIAADTSKKDSNADVLKNLTVLVAEDDEVGRLYFSAVLEKSCKKVIYASNGQETVDLCLENPEIDLVLMDIRMPLMNGYQATKKIRETNNQVVIFAQTAFAMSGDREKSLEAGCNEYLSKPIDRQLLYSYIEKHFKGKK